MKSRTKRMGGWGIAVLSAALLLDAAVAAPTAGPADLIKQLSGGDEAGRQAAQKQLVQMGTSAVAALLPALESQDLQTRESAITALGAIRDPRAVRPLAALLGDPDTRIRYAAAWALRRIGEPAAEALAAQLTGPTAEAHYPAAYALAGIEGFQNADPWLKALKDPDPRVRYYAVMALGNLRDPRAVDALAMAAKDTDALVRGQVPVAVAKRKALLAAAGAATGDSAADKVRFQMAMAAWENKGPKDVDLLIRGLQDSFANVRQHCAWALGDLRAKEGIEALIQVVEVPGDLQQVHYAVISLTQITGQNFGRDGAKWREWYSAQKTAAEQGKGQGK